MDVSTETIKEARRLLKLGSFSSYQKVMIEGIRMTLSEETMEALIKAGKQDGYSFRQYGVRGRKI